MGGTPQVLHEAVQLDEFANQTVRLQFSFNTNSQAADAFEGWFLRNIRVQSAPREVAVAQYRPLKAQEALAQDASASNLVTNFNDPVSDLDDNFEVSNTNGTAPTGDPGPFWQQSDSQDSTLGGPAWWFGNPTSGTEEGAYQDDPTGACSDGATSSGTITSGLIALGDNPELTFDTLFQIGSTDPAGDDLMQVQVLTGSAIFEGSEACNANSSPDGRYQKVVNLTYPTNAKVSVTNLSGYDYCDVDGLVNLADEGLQMYCGSLTSDSSGKQVLDKQYATNPNAMQAGDEVVVTDNAIYWFNRTKRSGDLAGLWAIEPQGLRDANFVDPNGCGLPQNYLLPGSSGELPKGQSSTSVSWPADGMAVFVELTCDYKGGVPLDTAHHSVEVENSADHERSPDATDPVKETSPGSDVWTLTFSGYMVHPDTAVLSKPPSPKTAGDVPWVNATDCLPGDTTYVHYTLTYTFGDNSYDGRFSGTTLPTDCAHSSPCALERDWLQIDLQLDPTNPTSTSGQLQVNTLSISFGIGNIVPPYDHNDAEDPVTYVGKYPYTDDVSTMPLLLADLGGDIGA